MDKGWVWHPRASIEYQNGVSTFVKSSSGRLGNPTEMICPCIDCRNLCHQPVNTVEDHLVIRGMDQRYKRNSCWSLHGDVKTDKATDGPSYDNEAYDLIRTAFFDGEENSEPHKEDQADGVDCNEEVEFKKKLQDAETPLYSSCPNYTKVSAIMGLYRIKVKSGMSENFFDQLLTLVHDMLPIDNVLPSSTDEMKRFLKMFGFGYDMIHACKNDCILYRKQYKDLQSCPRCNASRWKMDKHSGVEKKGIPAKVLRYFPIKERFRRMFRSKRIAEEVRWHINGASSDGTMRHPVDSITWANVNDKWPEFAAEPRNLRLGLSTDGMNPFSIQNSKYSIWPVLLVNYNMHPTKCMKAENIFLTLLIPGPTAPSNDIDVYLAPLVDDLQDLWNEGIAVFDSFSKEKFTLKAMLMWSITDYPGLGTLAGCKVKGKQACTVCGKHTHFKWLKFSRKHVYLGNRKRLRPDHPYRRRKKWFDNTVEEGKAHRIQSGTEIFEALKDFRNDFGKPLPKQSRRKRKTLCDDEDISEDEYEEDSDNWRWKKRSILFDLPYWKDMPVRHNLDVMHVEKNVSDAILAILMQSAKSKDGVKARKDLEDMGIREKLHIQEVGKRTYLPHASYWLTKDEKKVFCKRLSLFRGPDGYCANIANCVSVDPPMIGGLKSHDHHVLLQNLLPVALRGLLPDGPRIAVTRLCSFFSRLCQRVIDSEKLITLEAECVETLCQLERYFPPSLFDIMFHLPKKKSVDPSKVTRSQIWVAGHTHADGTPVRPEYANTIEKIKCLDTEMGSSDSSSVRDDAVSQVLGKDRHGRVRGMGRGVTATKIAIVQCRDAHVQMLEAKQAELINTVEALQIQVRGLAKGNQHEDVSMSYNSSIGSRVVTKCKLLDWYSVEDIVVGEGELCSTDAMFKIGGIPIGPGAVAVLVTSVCREDAFVWRPTSEVSRLGQALGMKIPWLADKIMLDNDSNSPTPTHTAGSSVSRDKVIIYDWNKDDVVVAEGTLISTDPEGMANNIPIGPNAAIVTVDKVVMEDSYMWRPINEKKYLMGSALNEIIAWPISKLGISTHQDRASPKASSPGSVSCSLKNSNSSGQNKCLLVDVNNSGEIVAEGKFLSNNPEDRVHFVPLGPNASKILVEVVKIANAEVWKPNSEIELVSDAMGSTVAWPNDKVVFL